VPHPTSRSESPWCGVLPEAYQAPDETVFGMCPKAHLYQVRYVPEGWDRLGLPEGWPEVA